MTERQGDGVRAAPRRGRPRSEGMDAAILTATLELAGEIGINGMSMDEISRRAGVSKATVYRRWRSKEALVLDALRSVISPLDEIDTGSLLGDLHTYLGELTTRMASSGPINDVLPHLIEAACHDESLRSSLNDYVQTRRAPLRTIFERAVQRGEVADDADVGLMIDVVIGPFVYRRLLTREPITLDFVDHLLALVLPALRY